MTDSLLSVLVSLLACNSSSQCGHEGHCLNGLGATAAGAEKQQRVDVGAGGRG